MASTFFERIDHLDREVGHGDIIAGVTVDQPYAQDQHETPYRHDSGVWKYLGNPLSANAIELIMGLSRRVITVGGSDIDGGMIDIADEMSGYVLRYAPKDTTLLSRSGNPWVRSNGVEIYNKPGAPRRKGPSESGWHRR